MFRQVLSNVHLCAALVEFLQIGNTLTRCCEQAPNCECGLREDASPVLLPSPTDEEEPLSDLPQQRPRRSYWVAFSPSNTHPSRSLVPSVLQLAEQTKYLAVLLCFPASFLHLFVAAAGVSFPGPGALPGLHLLLDPGLHHPSFKDECTDLGRHSSPAP